MAVSLYTLFQALCHYIAAHPQQFQVVLQSALCYRVDAVQESPPLPPLKISFINKLVPGTPRNATLVGRRRSRHGVDGWFWGEPGAETSFRIKSNGLTLYEAIGALASEVFPQVPQVLADSVFRHSFS
jgi:hypothetical protein